MQTVPVKDDVFDSPAPLLFLESQPISGHRRLYSRYGVPVKQMYDMTVRWVRDQPLGEWET
jgi:hypothetical protein